MAPRKGPLAREALEYIFDNGGIVPVVKPSFCRLAVTLRCRQPPVSSAPWSLSASVLSGAAAHPQKPRNRDDGGGGSILSSAATTEERPR